MDQDAIVDIRWVTDPSGAFKGFGFVEFKCQELAKQAAALPPLRVGS